MRDRLAVGRIQRSHGIGGRVRVQSFSGETRHFLALPAVYLDDEGEAIAVEQVQEVSGGVLLKLRGFDRREDADRLQGRVLWAAREFASPCAAGEFYVADLCGCAVRQGSTVVGTVAAFVEGGATGLLEVRSTKGQTFLVPFVDEYVGEVSVEGRAVELREGFEVP